MSLEREVSVPLKEVNIAGALDEPLYVRERPMESILRRLEELHIPLPSVADDLELELNELAAVLGEQKECDPHTLFALLDYVGFELVAIRDNRDFLSEDSHWFHRERCVYCKVNVYDSGLGGSSPCPSSPS